jgi:hypothetical protein
VDQNQSPSFDLSPHFFKNLADDVGLNMKSKRLAVRQIHQLDAADRRDPYRVLELYRSHLVKNYQGTFYLYPFTPLQLKNSPVIGNDGQAAWYNPKMPYGKNQLGAITKTQCTRVGMAEPLGGLGKWGAHGLRRKGLEGISVAGLGDTASMQFGGHTSVEGLKAYQDGSRATRKILTSAAFNGSTTVVRRAALDSLHPAETCKQLPNALGQLHFLAPSPATLTSRDLLSNVPVRTSTTPTSCRFQPPPTGWMPSPSVAFPFAQLQNTPSELRHVAPSPATQASRNLLSNVPVQTSTTPPSSLIQSPFPLNGWTPSVAFPYSQLPPAAPVLPTPAASGIKALLKELKECFDEGYMTADEYATAKAKALA